MVGERTRDGRRRSEEALIRFALLAGVHAQDFIVIGGLNPDYLAPESPLEHVGTSDLDLLFEIGFEFDREEDLNFGWLAELLERGGFSRVSDGGWEWEAVVADSKVRLQFICDDRSRPGQSIELPGAAGVAVMSFAEPGAILDDSVQRVFAVPDEILEDSPGAPIEVSLRCASLGGYLIAKSYAWLSRQNITGKDAYDLAFVTLHCKGGPRAAAEAVAKVQLSSTRAFDKEHVKGAFSEFLDPRSRAAGYYAREMEKLGDDEMTLRQDAAFGARNFLAHLNELLDT